VRKYTHLEILRALKLGIGIYMEKVCTGYIPKLTLFIGRSGFETLKGYVVFIYGSGRKLKATGCRVT
jgi:hypothetical protein